MKIDKTQSKDCVEVSSIISPKWTPIHINIQRKGDDDQYSNITVGNSKSESTKQEIENNNEFIDPTEKFKRSHFLLMDFSGLGSYKNEERKGFIQRKHRRKMILPHLNYSYKKEIDTQDRSLPKPKLQSLIIDLQRDNFHKEHLQRDKKYFQKAITPGPKKQGDIQQRIRTEPSSSKSFKLEFQDRIRRKVRGPRVIQNEILKHSTNLNIIRKKMFSQNRGRQPIQNRFNIQSSQNERFRSCNNIPQQSKEIELLTFYPKQMKQTQDEINQFLQDRKDDPPGQKEELYKFHFL